MRLTLRTLLAWMDDTLAPSDVKAIGHQVMESRQVQELVDRIRKVMRQRRLTIPGSGGAEATDPNLVADYLGNQLTPEQVADFERLCLSSDVHLAEVASVHQILSNIGQKAKVPPEARYRMYRLVKGRESSRSRVQSDVTPAVPTIEPTQPGFTQLDAWEVPSEPRPPLSQRLKLVGVAAALLLVMAWAANEAIKPLPAPRRETVNFEPAPVPPAPEPPINANLPGAPQQNPAAPGGIALANPMPTEPDARPMPEPAEAAKDVPKAQPAAGGNLVEQSEGLLLRFKEDTKTWERIIADSPLSAGDRLVALPPSRHVFSVAGERFEMFGGTEIRVLPDQNNAPHLTFVEGTLVVQSTRPPRPLTISLAGQPIKLQPPPGQAIGIERTATHTRGAVNLPPASLRVHIPEGPCNLALGTESRTFVGPKVILVELPRTLTDLVDEPPGAWVGDTKLSPLEQQLAEQFTALFQAGKPVLNGLYSALDANQAELQDLALKSLGRVGDVETVVRALDTPNAPRKRRVAVETLRELLARDPDSARLAHDQLNDVFGEELGQSVEKLLVGYTDAEAREKDAVTLLIREGLTSETLAIRELAIDNLQALTKRDRLGYDPDEPKGEGLKAWQDLVRPAAGKAKAR